MKTVVKTLLVLGVVCMLTTPAVAQVGVEISMGNIVFGGLGITSLTTGLHIPIRAGERLTVIPGASFYTEEDGGTIFALGVGIEGRGANGTASPIFGAAADVTIVSPDGGDSWTDFAFSGYTGAEVQIHNDISVIGRVGLTIALPEDGPTMVFTSTAVGLRFWVF